RELEAQSRGLTRELAGVLAQANPDPVVVGRKVITLRDLHEGLRKAQEALDAKLIAVLTPEQTLRLEGFRAAQAAPPDRARGVGEGMWLPQDGPGPWIRPGVDAGMPGVTITAPATGITVLPAPLNVSVAAVAKAGLAVTSVTLTINDTVAG